MSRLYRIRHWDRLYENNRSRRVTDLRWVPIPNSHDGENYTTIITHKDGAKIFAAWILLLQVASRCSPRGILKRANGQPHTPPSLATKTRAPEAWFELALPILEGLQWVQSEPVADENVSQVTLETSLRRQSGDEEGRNGMERKKEGTPPPPADSFRLWNKDRLRQEVISSNADKLLTPEEVEDFVGYWTEPSPTGRLRLAMEKTWDTRRRMNTALRVIYLKQRGVNRTPPKPQQTGLNIHEYDRRDIERQKRLDAEWAASRQNTTPATPAAQ